MPEMPISSGAGSKSVKLKPAEILNYLQHDADYFFIALQVIAKQENVAVRLLHLYQLLVQHTVLETMPSFADLIFIEGVQHEYDILDNLELGK